MEKKKYAIFVKEGLEINMLKIKKKLAKIVNMYVNIEKHV